MSQESKKTEFFVACAAPKNLQGELVKTAKAIASPGKGILAADESTGTIGKKFEGIGLENTEENRRAYREMLFTSSGIENYISGVILYEETLYQKTTDGTPFVEILKKKGIIPGIKVDLGLKEIPGTQGEFVTQGLTDLDVRCKKYVQAGAKFAKWRAVYKIGETTPSQLAIQLQAESLARYAAICQANGLVPIVEPEVMIDGTHTIDKCAYISEVVWAHVAKALNDNHVFLEGSLLKPNMVVPGSDSGIKATPHEIASYTVRSLQRTIPAAIPGIMFLSGGQTEEEASLNLSAMNALKAVRPWQLSFSYGRALQASAMKAWKGDKANVEAGQKAFLVRAKANSEAQLGKYGGSGDASSGAAESLFEKDYYY
eukprot:TRINITY_DN14813_c0_g1_i1.p1 TRINITY_DN14813_c0_g1~~TRINITY_DN14813_c0_g1_i1.p1  ORF type:complete len:372 (+),score=89.69 TRINITY_DN14813_c0_g1_i1:47-1162(+)